MNEELKRVKKIARIVRKAVEHLAKYESDDGDGSNYNDFDTLGGYCARATSMVSKALKKAKIVHTIIAGNGHVFIKWQDRIVDVTATQFSGKLGKVMVCTREELNKKVPSYKQSFWQTTYEFSDRKKLWSWQEENGWPECQCAHKRDDEFLTQLKEYKEYFNGLQK